MRGLFGPPRGPLERVLLVESAARESGELLLTHLTGRAGGNEMHLLTCYDTPPSALNQFAHTQCLSVHASEAVQNRTAYATQLARAPYDALIVLCTGSGVLAKWKWLLVLKTRSRVVFADEFGEFFFVTLRNPGPLLVLAIRRTRISSVPELLLWFGRMLMAPFVLAFLISHAMLVHVRRLGRQTGAGRR